MRLNEISYNDASPIDGYGPGFFALVERSTMMRCCSAAQALARGLVSKMPRKFYHWRVK